MISVGEIKSDFKEDYFLKFWPRCERRGKLEREIYILLRKDKRYTVLRDY